MDEERTSGPAAVEVPWGAREGAYGCLTAIALFLVVGVIGGVIAFVWMQADLPSISTEVIVQLVFALEAILLLPPWLFGPRRFRLGWESLGFRRAPAGRAALATLGGFGVVLLANAGWTLVMDALGLELTEQPNPLPLFGEGIGGLLMALFLGAVVAPVAEEVFFRGFLYPGLKTSWGRVAAMLVSAALFAVIHGFTAVIPPIFVIGIVLVWAYEYTGSLWPPILIHGAMNGLAFLSAYVVSTTGMDLGF